MIFVICLTLIFNLFAHELYALELPNHSNSVEFGLDLTRHTINDYTKNKADSLKLLLNNAAENDKIDILISLSMLYKLDSTEKAIDYGRQALFLARQSSNKSSVSNPLLNIGNLYLFAYDYKKAMNYFLEAIPLVEQTGGDSILAKTYDLIGSTYKKMSTYPLAIKYHKKSLAINKKTKSQKGIASSLNKIGNIYRRLGNFDLALNYYLKSVSIGEKQNDQLRVSSTYNNIGLVFYDTKNYSKALEYFIESLRIKKSIGYKKGIAITLNNIGNVYDNQDQFDKALTYYKKSLKIKEELGDKRGTGSSLNNIGTAFMKLEQYDLALKYFFKSLKVRHNYEDKYGTVLTLNNLTDIYLKQNKYNIARKYLNRSLKLAKEINSKRLMKDNYFTLSDYYSAKNDYKNSLKYFKLYSDYKDSLFNESGSQLIADMETKYETDKKEKENELLRQQAKIQTLDIAHQRILKNSFIAISALVLILIILLINRYRLKHKDHELLKEKNLLINKQKDELSKSYGKLEKLNSTKDTFFSIISHDLKNPFTTLLGYSDLLISNFDDFNDEEKISFINEINKSLKYTYNLLDNLLNWSMSQRGLIELVPSKLDFAEIAKETISLLEGSAKKKGIAIHSEINTETFVFADLNTITTVLRNLVTNAIKFTKNNGKVTIAAKINQAYCTIIVSDTGVGILPENLTGLFSITKRNTTVGTLKEKGTGLGLVLCKEFVEKNGGEIFVESKIDKGSDFIFTIPSFQN